jgi:hypothetical protein
MENFARFSRFSLGRVYQIVLAVGETNQGFEIGDKNKMWQAILREMPTTSFDFQGIFERELFPRMVFGE